MVDTGTDMDMVTIRSEKAVFIFWQTAILALNASTGFFIVQRMGKIDYAQYTIAFSFLAVFVNISNIGITPAMTGIGGRVWQDPVALRALLNSAFHLRRRIGLWLLLPFVVYCAWQFWKAGAGWFATAILVGCVLVAAWTQIQAALYAIVLQLHKAVRPLQQNELAFTALKVLGILPMLFFHAPVYLLIGWTCGCLALNLLANQKLARHYLAEHPETSPKFLREIGDIARPNAVRTVYWAFEGQISVLLCALFANTENIADIGALGRLSVLFAIFQAFVVNYSLPEIAKAQDRAAIATKAGRTIALSLLLVAPVLVWAVVHPASLLWVLGPNYRALTQHLLPFLLAVCLGQIAAVVYQICTARAWIRLNSLYVPIALPLQAVLIYALDLSQLENVILLLGINNAFFLLFNGAMFYWSLRDSLRAV